MIEAVIKDRSPAAIARLSAGKKTDPWTVLDALRQNLSAGRVLSAKQTRDARREVGRLHLRYKDGKLTLDQAIDELVKHFDDL